MKWIPTIRSFRNGKKIRDVASPWTLNLSRVCSIQAGNNVILPLHGREVFAGTGRVPRRISDHLNRKRITGASLDLNKVHNQERREG